MWVKNPTPSRGNSFSEIAKILCVSEPEKCVTALLYGEYREQEIEYGCRKDTIGKFTQKHQPEVQPVGVAILHS